MKLIKLFTSFLKVGVIGFGGGSALIPVVEREMVESQHAMDDESYLKHTVVANITPGALPVKLGATCGYELNGPVGSVVSAYMVTLPGVLLTVAIMALFSILGSNAITYFNYASVGISAFIIFLLVSYCVKTVKAGKVKVNFIICLLAFLVTGGKEIRQVLGSTFGFDPAILGTPLFDISTINLIIIAFYMILLTLKTKAAWELGLGGALSAVYAFLIGKTGEKLGISGFATPFLIVAMLGYLLVLFILRRNKSGAKSSIHLEKKAIITIALFLIIPVVITGLVMATGMISGSHNPAEFVGNVTLSTVTSFGGGEAYVSVADGIFVQDGYVAPDIFYSRLVPVANSLPGPILVKLAAGIGFLFGSEAGSPAAGWLLAAAAATAAMGICSAIAILVLCLYDSIKQSTFILNLKQYILPVICGMLVSTSLSMLYESMKITAGKNISGLIALPAIALLIVLMNWLHKKFHLHDVIMLIGAAVLSLGIFMLI